MSFVADSKSHFDHLKTRLFSDLAEGERLNLNLAGEDTLFVRLNNALVRQNTQVEQRHLELTFQKNDRSVFLQTDLSGDLETDTRLCSSLIKRVRAEVDFLPEDPGFAAFENRGQSQNMEDARELNYDEVLSSLKANAGGTDFTGLLASGPMIRANANSLGQQHWFSTRSFFLDYSLFTVNESGENKAVKGLYADKEWSNESFLKGLTADKKQLTLLKRPSREFKPGEARVYLAPSAVSELTGMLSWNALSYAAHRKGHCPFSKMQEEGRKLSPLFSIRENFDLGLTTPFNSLGEVPSRQVPLIEKGELRQFLISTRSAKEYGVEGNAASTGENLRSLEMLTGSLSERNVLKELGTGLYLNKLHYCNWSDVQTARVTGMTRYACFWVENGEIVAPIKDLRFDVSLYYAFGSELEAVTSESHVQPHVDTYMKRQLGGSKLPGLLINRFNFTL